MKTVQIGTGGWSHCHDEKPRRKIKDLSTPEFSQMIKILGKFSLFNFGMSSLNLLDNQLARSVIEELKN